jgi:hypothetical protein
MKELLLHIIREAVGQGVLHAIITRDEILNQDVERIDITHPSEFLQLAIINVKENKGFKAHRHLERKRTIENLRAQESWVVVTGLVRVDYFDENDSFLESHVLRSGDITITFRGGHGYEVLEAPGIFIEFKSGPYEGQQVDKTFLDDEAVGLNS